MPVVRLILSGYLDSFLPGGPHLRAVSPGTTAGRLAADLDIRDYHVGALVLNSVPCPADRVLEDGDELRIIPLVGGG